MELSKGDIGKEFFVILTSEQTLAVVVRKLIDIYNKTYFFHVDISEPIHTSVHVPEYRLNELIHNSYEDAIRKSIPILEQINSKMVNSISGMQLSLRDNKIQINAYRETLMRIEEKRNEPT